MSREQAPSATEFEGGTFGKVVRFQGSSSWVVKGSDRGSGVLLLHLPPSEITAGLPQKVAVPSTILERKPPSPGSRAFLHLDLPAAGTVKHMLLFPMLLHMQCSARDQDVDTEGRQLGKGRSHQLGHKCSGL